MSFDPSEAERERRERFLESCVSIDLEVDPKTARIFDFAAAWKDDRRPVARLHDGAADAWGRFEAALGDARHVIGHNILRHDIPHLAAARPGLMRLHDAPIDTLWLNPLAFPRNPYHHLVKHYQDGRLQAGRKSDPELDARLVFTVLENQLAAFDAMGSADADLLATYHYLTTLGDRAVGFDAVFCHVRGSDRPRLPQAEDAVRRLLHERGCGSKVSKLLETLSDPKGGWPLAYALSWIMVAGGNSVMPPWVRAQFAEASRLVIALRDSDCGLPDCDWCTSMNEPTNALKRWFGLGCNTPQSGDQSLPKAAQGREQRPRFRRHPLLSLLRLRQSALSPFSPAPSRLKDQRARARLAEQDPARERREPSRARPRSRRRLQRSRACHSPSARSEAGAPPSAPTCSEASPARCCSPSRCS